MQIVAEDTRARQRALERCNRFVQRYLPTLVRRLGLWKGLDPERHADVIHDLRQELVVDCLEHVETVDTLSDRQVRARWFRLSQKQHYRLSRAPTCDPRLIERIPDPVDTLELTRHDLPGEDVALMRRVASRAVFMKNGKLNVAITARRTGLGANRLRSLWLRTSQRLGFGTEHVAFWERRLVEALVALTATTLRGSGALRTFPRRGHHPRVSDCLRRVRRIRATLHAGTPSRRARRVVARSVPRQGACPVDPRSVVGAAIELAPDNATVQLWGFETFHVYGDLRRAAESIRNARLLGADPIRTLLARARLLEARGRTAAAAALLRRGLGRHPGDERLRASLHGLGTADGSSDAG